MEVLRFLLQQGTAKHRLWRSDPPNPMENATGVWAFGRDLMQAERARVLRSP